MQLRRLCFRLINGSLSPVFNAFDASLRSSMGLDILLVAACALIDADGRVLLAKRPPGRPLAGLWEFPGGKVEKGETPEAALIRELEEELAIVVPIKCLAPFTFASHSYEAFHLLMPLYVSSQVAGRGAAAARPGDHLGACQQAGRLRNAAGGRTAEGHAARPALRGQELGQGDFGMRIGTLSWILERSAQLCARRARHHRDRVRPDRGAGGDRHAGRAEGARLRQQRQLGQHGQQGHRRDEVGRAG